MKLVIREYLTSLRERGELDAVLPDMLTEMGFTVYSRPAVGTRQYGVDIAAVGDGQDGVRRVHLFSVKSGDLGRQDWDTASPQSLRPSLNEIRDHYVTTRIPPEYADLPIAICLCFGGDIAEQVRAEVTGYCRANTTARVTYEEWNGDRLAQVILDGILREELLPAALRGHLRKAVAMVEEPDIAMGHFARLTRELVDAGDDAPDRLARARLINICLWILFVWAREAGNVEAPYRASELAMLQVWNMLKDVLPGRGVRARNAGILFNELATLHFAIWDELYAKKVLPHAAVRHALATAVQSYAAIDVNLKLFQTIGRVALRGLWLVWEVPGEHSLPTVLADDDSDGIARIDTLCSQLVEIIANNRALLSPATDEQAIDIALVLTLLGTRPRFRPSIDQWIKELSENAQIAYLTHGRYPTTRTSYWDLVEHPAERTDEYRKSTTEGSVLYPLLALWAVATGNDEARDSIARFKAEHLTHCNFQLWLPDEDSETSLYLGDDNHGAALGGVPVGEGTTATLDYVNRECATNNHFDRLSAIALGHWPVLLTACRHHRLPVPPQIWRDLFPSLLAARAGQMAAGNVV